MVANFAAGGAAINQICAAFGLGLKVFELALDMPTGDITEDAAMDEKDCAATMAFGMEAIAGGTDLLASARWASATPPSRRRSTPRLYGGRAEDWVGRGTGVDDDGPRSARSRRSRRPSPFTGDHLDDPLEVLRRLGGREIAAMAGAILAARLQRIPVLLDGYVATAAAAILHAIHPVALDHCVAGHLSAEGAHQDVLERLGKTPLLALGMRLGEGSGAALAAGIVKAAAAVHRDMATFGQAGVSERLS